MQRALFIFFLVALQFFVIGLMAQVTEDSTVITNTPAGDTLVEPEPLKKFDPRVATRRSAILPGWGQIYNKKYWKLPLVYGALGTTAGVFFYNIKTYKLLKLAFILKSDTIPANDAQIDDRFRNLSAGALRSYRNSFRQNVDYSVLFFIVFWGLNVVDATVDGHLKQFDVNDNLSFELKPGYSPMANTAGISLVLDIHPRKAKTGK